MLANTLVCVFPAGLRDRGDGLGAVHSHSPAGEFGYNPHICPSVHQPEASKPAREQLNMIR